MKMKYIHALVYNVRFKKLYFLELQCGGNQAKLEPFGLI